MAIKRIRQGIKAILVTLLIGVGVALCLIAGLRGRTVSTHTMARWSRWLCRILNVRIVQHGQPEPQTAMFVANHVSWLDIFCIASVRPSFFLAKQDVAHWPVFGWLARRSGTAFIQRGADKGAREAAEQLTWRLLHGDTLVLFPEGTSTNGRSVKRFHPRLFQAAIHARCQLQAIAIRYPSRDDPGNLNSQVPFVGDDEFLSHLWRLLGEPYILVELHFAQPMSAAGQIRDTLARCAHQQIANIVETPASAQTVSANANNVH